jgi:hypothetical protein
MRTDNLPGECRWAESACWKRRDISPFTILVRIEIFKRMRERIFIVETAEGNKTPGGDRQKVTTD